MALQNLVPNCFRKTLLLSCPRTNTLAKLHEFEIRGWKGGGGQRDLITKLSPVSFFFPGVLHFANGAQVNFYIAPSCGKVNTG